MNETNKTPVRFLVPSIIGVILFLIPIQTSDGMMLIINIIINKTKELMGDALLPFVLLVLTFSAICSLIGFWKKDLFKGYWARLFNVNIIDLIIRITAAILAYLIYFKIGPEHIWSDDTGGMILKDVVSNLIPFFLWAGIFLPFLTEFGLMEFIGKLMMPIMKPIFNLPGRAAVNVIWVGSGSMDIVLTNREYEKGYYTKKEAVAIATGFSKVSIAIVALLCSFINMTSYFLTIYFFCIVLGLIINMIMIRIPPIRNMENSYFRNLSKEELSETVPKDSTLLKYAFNSALSRAQKPKENLIISGLKITGDIWFTLEPVVLTIGTIATIIVNYTSVIYYLSIPFAWILNLLGIPEATLAGQSIFLGFIDVFLPFVTGGAITSPMTKFILSVVCILQVIYMTETGPLLLKLKMGLRFKHIIAIFLLRTILALLLITPIAYLLF